MYTLLSSPLLSLAALVILYLWFRAAMWYLRNKHRLRDESRPGLIVLETQLAPGVLLDIIVNWTIGGVLGYVKVWTLSEKLAYIRKNPNYGFEWQRRFAKWV